MALSEFEIKRIEKLVGRYVEDHRPDPSIRSKLDLAFRIDNQSFVIYEIRPQWITLKTSWNSLLPKPPMLNLKSYGSSTGCGQI